MIIAHRGYYDKIVPENSMTAFIRCVEKNMPFETDVHLTLDKKVVVFHDYNLLRMTGVNKNIEDLTYDELKKLKLKHTNEHIPLLEDVLKMVNDRVLILLELKNKKVGCLEEKVLELTKSYKNIYYQSFNKKTCFYLKKRTNKKVGFLTPIKLSKKNKIIKQMDYIAINLFMYEKYNKETFIYNIKNKEDFNIALKYKQNYIVDINNVKLK